ncbi:MAG: SIS domain-containing protein [Trueperaceae bacterium]
MAGNVLAPSGYLLLGAAETVITPPLDLELAGYGPDIGRLASEVADHLFAQALVMGSGAERVAIVTCDLLGVSRDLVNRIRRRLFEQEGLQPDRVLVTATHTHTAPTVVDTRGWGKLDSSYVAMVERHLVGIVKSAASRPQPVRAWLGRSEYRDLAWNRTGSGQLDAAVATLHFSNDDGEVVAVLVKHACHPVTLGPARVVSADYPGSMRACLRKEHPGAIVAYLNGACADVDPVTHRREWGSGSAEDVRRFGEGLAAAATQGMSKARAVAHDAWTVRSSCFEVPFQPFDADFHQAEAERQERAAAARGQPDEPFGAVTAEVQMPRFWAAYHRDLLRRWEQGLLPERERIELQALCLGDELALLAIPAEVYAEHGLAIVDAAAFASTWVVGYANGYSGYLPPEREFSAAGYGTRLGAAVSDRQPFVSDVAVCLVDTAAMLLGRPESQTSHWGCEDEYEESGGPESVTARYADRVVDCLLKASRQERELEDVANLIADTIYRDALVFVGGSGHSHILAEEVFYRAGGLLAVHPLLVGVLMLHEGALRSTQFEQLEGVARIVLDDAGVTSNDLVIVASNSGRNAFPVELALEASQRGCTVVAVTSVQHTGRVTSRHSSGRRLIDIADVVLDNQAPYGDATVRPRGMSHEMGPVSTITGSYLLHSVTMRATEILSWRGRPPAVMVSANADESNEGTRNVLRQFRSRIRHL